LSGDLAMPCFKGTKNLSTPKLPYSSHIIQQQIPVTAYFDMKCHTLDTDLNVYKTLSDCVVVRKYFLVHKSRCYKCFN